MKLCPSESNYLSFKGVEKLGAQQDRELERWVRMGKKTRKEEATLQKLGPRLFPSHMHVRKVLLKCKTYLYSPSWLYLATSLSGACLFSEWEEKEAKSAII